MKTTKFLPNQTQHKFPTNFSFIYLFFSIFHEKLNVRKLSF